MLVITRRKNESVIIGDNIKITIVDVGPGGKVRFGIEAPKDVHIYRPDCHEQSRAQEKEENSNKDSC